VSELRRELRLTDATSLVIGTVIGSGIFVAPNLVARHIASPAWILAVWAFTGILTIFGGLAFAELGAMMPATGGQYVYLREAYGPVIAFLSGWAALLVIYTGALAWQSVTFAVVLNYFVHLTPLASKVVSVTILAAMIAVNYVGLRAAAGVQNALTLTKLGGLVTVICAAWLAPHAPAAPPAGAPGLAGFGMAMIGCLLTYDGWVALGFVAGEVQEPQRNLPRALLLGVGCVLLLYVLANAAYLWVMTPAEIGAADRVAAQMMERSVGPAGGAIVALAILFSVSGAMNGFMLAPPRIYYAMARDGVFFRRLGEAHPRFLTPHRAILLQGLWAILLVVTGTYESLPAFAMFMTWTFYGLSVAGVIVLRRRRPDALRPYRMWGYPWTALLFVGVAGGFALNTIVQSPKPAGAALLLALAGLPVYFFWRK
jgi:basic amino acid/polyamine antiporter, APA family